MFTEQKQEIIDAGIALDRYGLISLSGGMMGYRMESGEILVSPSGMKYDHMVPDDVVVMDIDGNIIEGDRKPSSDTDAVLYIFKHRSDINAVIHTHQPYATAVSLLGDDAFRVNVTTLGNVAGTHVPITPFSSAGSVEMGMDTVKYIGEANAVILAHHGVMAVGPSMKKALYTAVYMEDAAKTELAARAIGVKSFMTEEQVKQSADVFKYYGQDTAKIPRELTERI